MEQADLPGELADYGDLVGRPIAELEQQDQEEAWRHFAARDARELTANGNACMIVHTPREIPASFFSQAVYGDTRMNPEARELALEKTTDLLMAFEITCVRLVMNLDTKTVEDRIINKRILELLVLGHLASRGEVADKIREWAAREIWDSHYKRMMLAAREIESRPPDSEGHVPELNYYEIGAVFGLKKTALAMRMRVIRRLFREQYAEIAAGGPVKDEEEYEFGGEEGTNHQAAANADCARAEVSV